MKISEIDILQKIMSITDLEAAKSHVEQIFPDTAAKPRIPAHIKAETDGRISQTIVRIQNNEPKRAKNAGFSNRRSTSQMAHRDYNLTWTEGNRLYKSHD